MAKQTTKVETKTAPKTGEITFSIVARSAIPTIARIGRASKYEPLYAQARTLGQDEVIELPLAKYSQVQAFKPTLTELGLICEVRKLVNEDGSTTRLSAFISHPVAESESKN